MSSLDQLKEYTTVVVDTGNIKEIGQYKPQDATTNPSLLLKAIQADPDSALVQGVLGYVRNRPLDVEQRLRLAQDLLAVRVGKQILELIPGRVSTEIPARLSFDTNATYDYANKLMRLYGMEGVKSDRVLVKIAATLEGIQAAKILEEDGIHCNLTLVFALEQAIACAEAGVTLISPFVGRIYDWHMKDQQRITSFTAEEDPGVLSVREIYHYLKCHGYKTQIMGASFRNVDEVLALAGCDLLTVSPKLLAVLEKMDREVPRVLSPEGVKAVPRKEIDEITFRTALTMNAMAYEKLGEGLRIFAADAKKLEDLLRERL